MLLAIDVGNTNIVFAISDAGRIVNEWRAQTSAPRTADEHAVWLSQLMSLAGHDFKAIDQAIIASVVPRALFDLQILCRKYFGCEPVIVGEDAALGIGINVDRPQEVGADRMDRLGHTEVDHLRHGLAVADRDEDAIGLDVAVDNAFLVRVLDSLADTHKEIQPLLDIQTLAVAMVGDGDAGHMLHNEVRPTIIAHARVEDLGHARVVHHRQGLTLGLESGDNLLRIHAQLDELQCDTAADRLGLLSEIDDAHPPLSDLLEDSVRADTRGTIGGTPWLAKRLVVRASLAGIRLCHEENPSPSRATSTINCPPIINEIILLSSFHYTTPEGGPP